MELNEICKSMLDNADMSMDLRNFPEVKLSITVQGKVNDKFWQVLLTCGQVVYIDIEADDDTSPNELIMVLETEIIETTKEKVTPAVQHRMDQITDTDKAWLIKIYGGISLSLVTTQFDWQLLEISESEYEAIYA